MENSYKIGYARPSEKNNSKKLLNTFLYKFYQQSVGGNFYLLLISGLLKKITLNKV